MSRLHDALRRATDGKAPDSARRRRESNGEGQDAGQAGVLGAVGAGRGPARGAGASAAASRAAAEARHSTGFVPVEAVLAGPVSAEIAEKLVGSDAYTASRPVRPRRRAVPEARRHAPPRPGGTRPEARHGDQREPRRGQEPDGEQPGADAERVVPAPRAAHRRRSAAAVAARASSACRTSPGLSDGLAGTSAGPLPCSRSRRGCRFCRAGGRWRTRPTRSRPPRMREVLEKARAALRLDHRRHAAGRPAVRREATCRRWWTGSLLVVEAGSDARTRRRSRPSTPSAASACSASCSTASATCRETRRLLRSYYDALRDRAAP